MLDGSAGSFTLSVDGAQKAAKPDTLLEWAWSSNVRSAVRVSADGRSATSMRWDLPHESATWNLARGGENEVRRILEVLESSPKPPSSQSVIHRALATFQILRDSLEERGGSETDVVFAFNALLEWARARPGTASQEIDFSKMVMILRERANLEFSPASISARVRHYALGALLHELKYGRDGHFTLDADLLVRHASGVLYQEAHRRLAAPVTERQRGIFDDADIFPSGRARKRLESPSFVHFTPPSLARLLAEVALKIAAIGDREIDILDPACGSGVFLIEAARESGLLRAGHLTLRGLDESVVAIEMARFCVDRAASDYPHSGKKNGIRVELDSLDSLGSRAWGSPDVILMNPPFKKWEQLKHKQRDAVTQILGNLMSGRPDLSTAFLIRAARSIAPGGVVASVLPASFLESVSAKKSRQWLLKSGEFQIHLIGLFRGYGFFEDASVAPAFIVLSKTGKPAPIRVISANTGSEEKAIRWLRAHDPGTEIETVGFEVYSISSDELSGESWTPRRRSDAKLARAIKKTTPYSVGDFFTPRLGVRVGDKKSLLLSASEFRDLCRTEREQKFFRPTADRIEDGQIIDSTFLFYPYSHDGSLLIETEDALRKLLPDFYERKLSAARDRLEKKRTRYRNWWEPTRPVQTWLAMHEPRIVTQAFGHGRNIAFDEEGKYAVVQGVGWCWNVGVADADVMYGYLALVNSQIFEFLLQCHCPQLHGGQLSLYPQHIKHVPLPPLGDQRKALSKIGRQIHNGDDFDSNQLERLAEHAYWMIRPIDDNDFRNEFESLSDEWTSATGVLSLFDQKARHPAYRRIIEMGQPIVGYLLRDLKKRRGRWMPALSKITGVDPVPEGARSIEDAIARWIKWGKEHGYDV